MEKEIWKDVVGYEGLYQVSSVGDIKSLYKNIILGKHKHNHGYYSIALFKNNFYKHMLIHRLVAQAFITNTFQKTCVNHKNGIKTDNRVENLEWCSYSENQKHAFATGLNISPMKGIYGSKHPGSRKIRQYNLQLNLIKERDCIKTAEEETKIHHISSCARGSRNTAGGYIWKYF